MKNIIALLAIISVTSCGTYKKETNTEEKTEFKVEYKGALKNMLHN